nr:hypothetical protein [Ningiella sp. W23]
MFLFTKRFLRFKIYFINSRFFLFGALIHSSLKEFDDGTYIYRYVVWALNDLSWMALVAYWGLKDKLHLWQCVLGQLVVIGAPILQLFRLVDRHLWDLSYSTYMYKTLLPLINIGTIIVCYLPLLYIFVNNRNKALS